MKTEKIYKLILFFIIFVAFYNLTYLVIGTLPDELVNYNFLQFLDRFFFLRIPSCFLSSDFYFHDPYVIVRNSLLDPEAIFSSFPFILMLIAALLSLKKNNKSKLLSISILIVLLTIVLDGIHFFLSTYQPIWSVLFRYFVPFVLLSIILLFLNKQILKERIETQNVVSVSTMKLIGAYFIDVVFGVALTYLFTLICLRPITDLIVPPAPGLVSFLIFHFLNFKISFFIYSLVFELVINTTIGKSMLNLRTVSETGKELSFFSRLKYATFQLIPFWFLFKSSLKQNFKLKIDIWTQSVTFEEKKSKLGNVLWIVISLIILSITCVYSVSKNEFSYSHYIKPPIEINSYSNFSRFDSESATANDYFQFRLGEYTDLLEVTPISNNIKLITFKSLLGGNNAQINFSLTNRSTIFRIKLKMQKIDGSVEYLEVIGYQYRRLKVVKL